MRTFLGFLPRTIPVIFLFVCISSNAVSQRPWIKGTTPSSVVSGNLDIVANTLLTYGAGAAYSYDQGAMWTNTAGISGLVRCAVDFTSVTGSIAITQQPSAQWAYIYFSTNGSSWTLSDSVDVQSSEVIEVATYGFNYYLATSTAIYVGGSEVKKIDSPGSGSPAIFDIASTSTALVILKADGVHLSSDAGANWNEVRFPNEQPTAGAVENIVLIGGSVYTTSVYGVSKLDETTSRFEHVSKWPDSVAAPNPLAVAGDAQNLVALVNIKDQTQMYKLGMSDTAWTECGYPLPGTGAGSAHDQFVLDNSWAVVYHDNPESGTRGIYRYDINDFTDVEEEDVLLSTHIYGTETGLFVTEPPTLPYHIRVYDMSSRLRYECDVEGGTVNIPLSQDLRGVMCIQLTANDGKYSRTCLLR